MALSLSTLILLIKIAMHKPQRKMLLMIKQTSNISWNDKWEKN